MQRIDHQHVTAEFFAAALLVDHDRDRVQVRPPVRLRLALPGACSGAM